MIGLVVNKLLKDSSALFALVGLKIYPYAIEEDDTLPGVLYRVVSVEPEYDKDGIDKESNQVEVLVYAKTYSNCLSIAKEIRDAIEFKRGDIDGTYVSSCRVEKITEDYDFSQNIYFSTISFLIITQ